MALDCGMYFVGNAVVCWGLLEREYGGGKFVGG